MPCPASGFNSPHNMRMVVVLPLPLGPRKPDDLPFRHFEIDMVHHHPAAEALRQPIHLDNVTAPIPSAAPRLHYLKSLKKAI